MKRLPASYVVSIVVLGALAILVALVAFGVRPFDNLAVFILSSIASALILLVLGVIGGAFVGMLLAHRILFNREFSPFERTVIESLADIRARLERLEAEKKAEAEQEAMPKNAR